MAPGLEQIGLAGRDPEECITGTDLRDGTFVAADAAVVAHLKKERPISKPVATLDTFGATDAQLFVYRVFIIRVFDECPLDGRGRTQAVLRAGVEVVRSRFEISSAKLAITANRIGVNTFNGRLLEHAVRRAIPATDAFLWVNLPNGSFGSASPGDYPQQPTHSRHGSQPRAVAQKFAPTYW